MSSITSQASSSENTLDAVGAPPRPERGARVHALLASDTQADQGADLAAELDRLVGVRLLRCSTSISPCASL